MSSEENWEDKLLFLQNELNKYGFKSTINYVDESLYFGYFDLSDSDKWFVLLMKVKANHEGYVVTYITLETPHVNVYYRGKDTVTVELVPLFREFNMHIFDVDKDRLKFTKKDIPEFAQNPAGFIINKIDFTDCFPSDEYIYWISDVIYSDF